MFEQSMDRQIATLESIRERLDLYPEALPGSQVAAEAAPTTREGSKVFVVHGHDEAARLAVASFLQKIGLEAITLQEQPDQSRTIIEKFEASAREVGFAVVLLTPDDVGGAVSASLPMSRARQNVIFELGYFVGKLGREKVCLLRKGEIEGFSDFDGVLYTPMDSGDGWKLKLTKELRAAEFEFDDAKVWA